MLFAAPTWRWLQPAELLLVGEGEGAAAVRGAGVIFGHLDLFFDRFLRVFVSLLKG